MQFQLVLQFDADSLENFDAIVALEDELIAELGDLAEVDGHDFGANETNIFILTVNPVSIFERSKDILFRSQLLEAVTVAYRPIAAEDYSVLWPTTFRGKFVVA